MDTPYIYTVMKSDADPLDFASGPPPEARIPIHAIRGRGAATAMPHRFAKDSRTVVDDGWDFPWDGEAQATPQPTRVHLLRGAGRTECRGRRLRCSPIHRCAR